MHVTAFSLVGSDRWADRVDMFAAGLETPPYLRVGNLQEETERTENGVLSYLRCLL